MIKEKNIEINSKETISLSIANVSSFSLITKEIYLLDEQSLYVVINGETYYIGKDGQYNVDNGTYNIDSIVNNSDSNLKIKITYEESE